jgi:hypothetical protein
MRCLLAIVSFALLHACSRSQPEPRLAVSTRSVALDIDGARLFVPVRWAAGRPWDPRPWPNGVHISTGGWGSSKPWLGPIEASDDAPGIVFHQNSTGQKKRPGNPDSFFYVTCTFEFPQPPATKTWWGGTQQERAFPFDIDQVTLSYFAPSEDIPRPYVALLKGLKATEGESVGDGWREVSRPFDRRQIRLRFDASDWVASGGAMPRHLAASFGPPFWSHFLLLDRPRWVGGFETLRLPVDQWRARYETTSDVFSWLQRTPETRDERRRFTWWAKPELRPAS